MKPPFTAKYDESGNCLYITGSDNRPATKGIELEGMVFRFADNDLVGITIIDPDEVTRDGFEADLERWVRDQKVPA